jgi:hypothetical protein
MANGVCALMEFRRQLVLGHSALLLVTLITAGALYDIDDRAGDDLARRAELRRPESRAVLDELYAWLCDPGDAHHAIDWQGRRLHTHQLGSA